jgi:hypothetical protein
VPEDIVLDGDEETFIVHVLYDTRELYGEISARREIVIARD